MDTIRMKIILFGAKLFFRLLSICNICNIFHEKTEEKGNSKLKKIRIKVKAQSILKTSDYHNLEDNDPVTFYKNIFIILVLNTMSS